MTFPQRHISLSPHTKTEPRRPRSCFCVFAQLDVLHAGKLSATAVTMEGNSSDTTGHGASVDADLDQDNMPYSMLSPKMRAVVSESEWRTASRVDRRKCLDADVDTDLDRDMPYTMLAALMRKFFTDPDSWRKSPRADRQKVLDAQAKLHKVVVEELLKVQPDRIVSFAALSLPLILQEEGIIDEAEAQRSQEAIAHQERQHRAAQEKQLRHRLALESAQNARQMIETFRREQTLAHERAKASTLKNI